MLARLLLPSLAIGAALLCASCCEYGDTLFVEGCVVSSETGAPIVNAYTGGRTFTDGEMTNELSAGFTFSGKPFVPPTDEEGSFRVSFSVFPSCDPNVMVPRPDRVEIIVVDETCVREFSVDINEETALSLDPQDGGPSVIQLKDAIQIPSGTDDCVSCIGRIGLRGVVLNADTLDPLGNEDVRASMFSGDEKIAITVTTDPRNELSASDGTFDRTGTGFGACRDGIADLGVSDKIEVTVRLKNCSQGSGTRVFSVPVNGETVLDPTPPVNMLELRDPILVPPCPEEAEGG